jgi:hypothetical protein
MKKSICIMFALSLALPIVAKATIKFKSTRVDFGEIESGKSVDVSFEFENAGTELLVIKNVIPSCGCTAIALAKREYKSGEKGTISGRFNSSGYNGKIAKSITVVSNDTDAVETRLIISGTVLVKDSAQAELKPDRVNFETVTVGKTYTRRLNLSNSGTQDLRIIEIGCPPEVSLQFRTHAIGAKKTSEIVLNFTPFAKGTFSSMVKIRTNDYRNPYVFIRLEAQVE